MRVLTPNPYKRMANYFFLVACLSAFFLVFSTFAASFFAFFSEVFAGAAGVPCDHAGADIVRAIIPAKTTVINFFIAVSPLLLTIFPVTDNVYILWKHH